MKKRRLIYLDPQKIIPPERTRSKEDRYKLFLLSESIRENGVLFPVTVKDVGIGYQVINGEKRVKASILAEKKKIPCMVVDYSGDQDLLRLAENFSFIEEDIFFFCDEVKRLAEKYSLSSLSKYLSVSSGEIESIIAFSSYKEKNKRLSFLSLLKDEQIKEKEKEEIKEKEKKKEKEKEKEKEKGLPPIKDLRFAQNSIRKLCESIKNAGRKVKLSEKETDKEVEISLKIEKEKNFSQISIF